MTLNAAQIKKQTTNWNDRIPFYYIAFTLWHLRLLYVDHLSQWYAYKIVVYCARVCKYTMMNLFITKYYKLGIIRLTYFNRIIIFTTQFHSLFNLIKQLCNMYCSARSVSWFIGKCNTLLNFVDEITKKKVSSQWEKVNLWFEWLNYLAVTINSVFLVLCKA